MDDFAEKIQSILSDEESMKQIGELAAMLGLSGDATQTNLPNMPTPSSDSGFDISALASLAGMLKNSGANDDNVNFLVALKPLLSDEKKKKADNAIKILKLLNLLPILKDSGILGGDFLGIL